MSKKRKPDTISGIMDLISKAGEQLLKRRQEKNKQFLRQVGPVLLATIQISLEGHGVPEKDLTLLDSLNQRGVFSVEDFGSIAEKLAQWPAEKIDCPAAYARFCLLALKQQAKYTDDLDPELHRTIATQVGLFLKPSPKDDDSPRSVISDEDLRTLSAFCQTAPDQAESPPARPDSP